MSYVMRINPQYIVALCGNSIELKNNLRKIARADCADPAEMTRHRRRLLSGLNRVESTDPAEMTIFFSFQICRCDLQINLISSDKYITIREFMKQINVKKHV